MLTAISLEAIGARARTSTFLAAELDLSVCDGFEIDQPISLVLLGKTSWRRPAKPAGGTSSERWSRCLFGAEPTSACPTPTATGAAS